MKQQQKDPFTELERKRLALEQEHMRLKKQGGPELKAWEKKHLAPPSYKEDPGLIDTAAKLLDWITWKLEARRIVAEALGRPPSDLAKCYGVAYDRAVNIAQANAALPSLPQRESDPQTGLDNLRRWCIEASRIEAIPRRQWQAKTPRNRKVYDVSNELWKLFESEGWEDKWTVAQLAELCGCSKSTIAKTLPWKEYMVRRRNKKARAIDTLKRETFSLRSQRKTFPVRARGDSEGRRMEVTETDAPDPTELADQNMHRAELEKRPLSELKAELVNRSHGKMGMAMLNSLLENVPDPKEEVIELLLELNLDEM